MNKYLFHTLFRLSKEGIMTSYKSIAFFLLLSTQVLFGAKDEAASTTTMHVYKDGTKQLVCYTGVPGLTSSDKYLIEVKLAGTSDPWVKLFTHKTDPSKYFDKMTSTPSIYIHSSFTHHQF